MSWTSKAVSASIAVSNWLNPVTTGPAGPLAAEAALVSFGPSLMPRKSAHQGVAAGLALLAARAVGSSVDSAARRIAPDSSPLAWKFAARGFLAAGGAAISRIAEEDGESTPRASLRTAGRLVYLGAVGGMIHEVGKDLSDKVSAPVVPIVTGLGGFAFVATRWARELQVRNGVIQRWSDDDKPADLPTSIAIAAAVANFGRLGALGFRSSRRSLGSYLGETPGHRMIGYGINLAIWGAGAVTVYFSLVGRLAGLNSKVEPAFSEEPSNPHVSGGPESISPFTKLGLQGRRYVTEVVSPEVIEETLGEPASAHPIRAYIGYDSEPIYPTKRSELAQIGRAHV